jgi:hypothetical protein
MHANLYLGTCILAVHLNTQRDTSSSFPDMQHIQSALEVRLKDTSSATLQAVLRFCYTAECHLTPDNVLPICALAEHFEVKALHSACVQFIEHNISVSSCCTMLEMAAQYNMEALRKVTHYPALSCTTCRRPDSASATIEPVPTQTLISFLLPAQCICCQ